MKSIYGFLQKKLNDFLFREAKASFGLEEIQMKKNIGKKASTFTSVKISFVFLTFSSNSKEA
jgi:hypothetical protein